jgi:hypothetical protein
MVLIKAKKGRAPGDHRGFNNTWSQSAPQIMGRIIITLLGWETGLREGPSPTAFHAHSFMLGCGAGKQQ